MSCEDCQCDSGGCANDSTEEALRGARLRKAVADADIAEMEVRRKRDEALDRDVKDLAYGYLYINSVIKGNTADAYLDHLHYWERRYPGKDIWIDINTPGGSVTDGLAIYDQVQRLRRKGHKVTTRAVGGAFSMGAVLLQAGDVRIIDPRAKILIHQGSGGMSGDMTVGEQEDARAFREMLLNDVLDILAERSTLSKRQIKNRWTRKDWYLNADEAVKLGFADLAE